MSEQQNDAAGTGSESSGLGSIMERLSSPGELIVVIGAALVMFVDILGDVILDEYSFSPVTWSAAILILIAVVAHRWGGRSLFAAYGRALTVLALVAGVAVARELVGDVESDSLDGGTESLMALLLYISGALLLVGAWQQWSSEDS